MEPNVEEEWQAVGQQFGQDVIALGEEKNIPSGVFVAVLAGILGTVANQSSDPEQVVTDVMAAVASAANQ